MINKPDRPGLYTLMDEISLFSESTDERKHLEKSKPNKSSNIKSSAIVPNYLPKIAPFESNANLCMANKENAISNSDNSLSKDFGIKKRHPRITELITKEQKEIIERSYEIDMTVVDKKEVARNMTIRKNTDIECNICFVKYSRRDKCEVS